MLLDGLDACSGGLLALALLHAVACDGAEPFAALLCGFLELCLHRLDLACALRADLVCQEALDLWALEAVLLVLLGDLALDDELADVSVGWQVPELADGSDALWAEGAWVGDIGDTFECLLANLADGEVEHGDVVADDVTADGLSAALARAATECVVANSAALEQEGNASWGAHTVHHWETFSVGATADLEGVAGELLAEGGALDFNTEALAEDVGAADLIFSDLECLDCAVASVSDVELHFFLGGVRFLFFFSRCLVPVFFLQIFFVLMKKQQQNGFFVISIESKKQKKTKTNLFSSRARHTKKGEHKREREREKKKIRQQTHTHTQKKKTLTHFFFFFFAFRKADNDLSRADQKLPSSGKKILKIPIKTERSENRKTKKKKKSVVDKTFLMKEKKSDRFFFCFVLSSLYEFFLSELEERTEKRKKKVKESKQTNKKI